MSAGSVIAGASAAAKVAKEAGKAFVKGVNLKRRVIAREELDANKDLDGDGVVGGVGCGPREHERLRRRERERRADRQRKILEQGR